MTPFLVLSRRTLGEMLPALRGQCIARIEVATVKLLPTRRVDDQRLFSISAQLGNAGCVIAVEHGFYVFFEHCLRCPAVLAVEPLRIANRSTVRVDRTARLLFVTTLLATGITAWRLVARWN